MASPLFNLVPSTNYSTFPYGDISSLLKGVKWGGAVGTAVTLSYSFPVGASYWNSPSYSSLQEYQSMYNLNAAHQSAVNQALAVWASISNVSFVQFSDTNTTVGEMRFGFSDRVSASAAAHAYSPGGSPASGDVWFNPDSFYDSTAKGGFFFSTILHEVGHALGLNHSFAMGARDNYFYSIMSYTASPWSSDGDNYASFYPTTPMYDDLRAIHAIYGRDMTTNAGNSLYNFTGGRAFMTIYDAGGTDQFMYSGALSCTINLNPGAFSAVSAAIFFSGGVSSRTTVCIGPNTVIENATGGNLADSITGNSANNILNGRSGNDGLRGYAGNDRLIGGTGVDAMYGDSGADTFDFNSVAEIGLNAGGRDVIRDFSLVDDYLDFTTIDANPFTALNDAFHLFLPASSVFGGARGEMRWYQANYAGTVSDRTYVIGDVNGDRVADFRLEIIGLHTLRDVDILQ